MQTSWLRADVLRISSLEAHVKLPRDSMKHALVDVNRAFHLNSRHCLEKVMVVRAVPRGADHVVEIKGNSGQKLPVVQECRGAASQAVGVSSEQPVHCTSSL